MTEVSPLPNHALGGTRVSRWSAAAVALIGMAVLVGWRWHQELLLSLLAGSVTMKPNSALCFVLSGLALYLLAPPAGTRPSAGRRKVALWATLLVMAVAALTALEYLGGWNLGIDELLFRDVLQNKPGYFPGRMSIFTVVNLLCTGGALLALRQGNRPRLVQVLAGFVALTTLTVLLGTSYGVDPLYVGGQSIAVALHTNAAFTLLSVGLVWATGSHGLLRLLGERGAAGIVLRRQLPAAILVPVLIGWLRMLGDGRGVFATELGVSILSLANILTFTGLVCWSAHALRRIEVQTRRAESALGESLQRYAFLADTMPQIVWTSTPDGLIDSCNKAWTNFTGLSMEESIGEGWSRALHPEDEPGYRASWQRALASGEGQQIECRFRRAADGLYRWHLERASAQRDAQGRILYWVGTCTDIDDQKRAEESLTRRVQERTVELSQAVSHLHLQVHERERAEQSSQLIMDHSRDVICTMDEAGRFTKISRACQELWGYRADELLGRDSLEFLHPEDRDLSARITAEIRAGKPANGFENRFLRKDGTDVPIVWSANWLQSAKTMFCVARDVSERKRIEGELHAAKENAELANQSKSLFLANMSHEIRTPMNGVIGMTGLLLDTELSTEQRDYARTIRNSGENLLTVINDILDFSKIEAGKLSLETRDFDLLEAVEGTLDLLTEPAQTKGIELAGLIEPGVPCALQGDATRLRQVLTNLVGNGIKFTARGEVSLRVDLREQTPTHATLRFSITDTGIGIDHHSQAALFQAFTQADVSTTRQFGGTGLGLAICKQLVENMGGQIGVQSAPGSGSTFWFTLPFLKQSSPARPADAPRPLPGMRVLLVDDNATSAGFLSTRLAAWNIPSACADSGADALTQLHLGAATNAPFTLAIIDAEMPEMDGLALAQSIRSDPPLAATRIVVLTSRSRPLSASQIRDAGILQCLPKPVRQSPLLDCLATISGEQAQPRESTPAGSNIVLRAERILLAEDNPINQKVALGQLRKLGYTADAVGTGIGALMALQNHHYDVVFMDCQMPEMDGYEATRNIRRLESPRRDTWIIAMTANAMTGDREKCLAAGMNDYVSKPVRIETLRAALERRGTRTEG